MDFSPGPFLEIRHKIRTDCPGHARRFIPFKGCEPIISNYWTRRLAVPQKEFRV